MKSKLAIVHCVHHKPWLIMSTLITTLIQSYQDYDIYFLYQEGNGTDAASSLYQEYFREYYALIDECGINKQLDPYDPRTKNVCRISGKNIHELHFQNDHALDSGAWYKFIRTGLWKKYDYVLFMGEGALLTRATVLSDTLQFASDNHIHFITGAQEKRRFPQKLVLNGFASSKKKSQMTAFHDRMIKETFEIFCRDSNFRKVMESWTSDFAVEQQHHVPDIWGYKGHWMKTINIAYPNPAKMSSFPKQQIKYALSRINKFVLLYLNLISVIDKIEDKGEGDSYIYVNGARKKLSDVVDFHKSGSVRFHKSNEPEWFGATCNHLMSKKFLEEFSGKLEQYKIYDVLDLPFSATALEIIWGLIPIWLGFEKWFFDGIHRVRKNFVTYRREDDPEGMVRYINRYYRGKLSITYHGDFIKVSKCSDKFKKIKDSLNGFYFQ